MANLEQEQEINTSENQEESDDRQKDHVEKAETSERLHFLSAQRYYMIAILSAVFFSIYSGVKFGLEMGGVISEGTWFTLKGLSLWFPTSVLILPLIFLMFLYVLFSVRWVTIQKEEGSYSVKEKYLYFRKQKTQISEEKVQYIKFSQGHLGPKLAWIILFGAHMIYILTEGLHILTNPHVFGYGIMNGAFFLTSGLIDALILKLILVPGENLLEIHTKDEIYKLKISYWKSNKDIPQKIKQIFGLNKKENLKKAEITSPKLSLNNISLSKYIVLGIMFIIIGILSTSLDIFAGAPLRISLYYLGMIYITLGYNLNPNSKKKARKTKVIQDREGKELFMRRKGTGRDVIEYYRNPTSPKENEIDSAIRTKTMNWLETILVVITILFLGWTLSAWFRFLPSPMTLQGISTLMVLGTLILLGVLIDAVISPQHNIMVGSGDKKRYIELPQVKIPELNKKHDILQGSPIKNWLATWKAIWEKQKKTVILRTGTILAVFGVGIVIALF